MILQLNPQIPVITPRGKGAAIGWIDYSAEHDIMWIVFQDDTNECWTWRNKDIRAQQNLTAGRGMFPESAAAGINIPCGTWAAFEAGFRSGEKSQNIQEAMAKFRKTLTEI